MMLCFDSIERRSGPKKVLDGRTIDVPQLWLDEELIANSFIEMTWCCDPVQFTVCDCGYSGCIRGDYLSLRRTGDVVVFLPAFARWDGDFGINEYAEPALKDGACAGFMHQDRYETLRSFGTIMPSFGDLKPLPYGEAIALWYFETPRALRSRDHRNVAHALAAGHKFGAADGLIGLDKSAILCTNGESEEQALGLLRQALLSAVAANDTLVELFEVNAEAPVTVYLDVPEFLEWRALAQIKDRWCALLTPNLGFELGPSVGS